MREKFQKFLAAMAIIFILPYVIVSLGSPETRETYAVQKASGNFISIQTKDGIREISFEDYVCGVAAQEMDDKCPLEAVKAQMVIVRTNLKKFQEEHPGTLLSEEYLTLEEMAEKGILDAMLQAAEETQGQVLSFEGELVRAPYHAVSSGRTRSGAEAGLGEQYPWLTGVESRQDVESEWYLSVGQSEPESLRVCIAAEYPEALTEGDLMGQIEILSRDEGGYVTRMRVGNQEMTGEKFRSLLNLPSSCFYMEENEGKIRITVKGLGHGMGLSLYGARRMAEAGTGYQEILQYYFENCIIS